MESEPIQRFVYEVLTQIQTGITKAQAESDQDGGGFKVNPGGLVVKDTSGVLSVNEDGYVCAKVEFDLSVAVEEGAEANGGFKLSLFGHGFSAGGKVNEKSGSNHRVKFFVPVEYPTEKK